MSLGNAESQVAYGNQSVSLGNELTTTDVADLPTKLSFQSANASKLYTVLLTGDFFQSALADPDAPSREDPKFGPWRHYVRVNVLGKDFNSSGEVSSPYIGAKPPANTGGGR